jgi:hypothetical protein
MRGRRRKRHQFWRWWGPYHFGVRGRRSGGTDERNEADRDGVKEVSAGNPTSVQLGKVCVVDGLSSMR